MSRNFNSQIINEIWFGYLRESFYTHNDVIKWKLFPRYWPFVRGIQRSPVNSAHKGQWRRALMFSSICTWIDVNREAGDLRRHRAHDDIIVMRPVIFGSSYDLIPVSSPNQHRIKQLFLFK